MRSLWSAVVTALLLFLTSNAFALENCTSDEKLADSLDLLEKELKAISWFSATEQQVLKAKCSQGMTINNASIEKYFSAKPKSIVPSRDILGIAFKDEDAAMLELFSKLVDPSKTETSVFRRKNSILDPSKIPSSCTKVLCATEALFGKNESRRLLYLLDKHGLNGSHLVYENASPWRWKELDSALQGLDDLASFQQKRQSNNEFYHFKRGYTRGSDSVIANAVMEYFDAWSNLSEGERRYTVFHEVSHNLSYLPDYFRLDNTPEWLKLSQWEKIDNEWTAKNSKVITSEYGFTNPSEDFAESLSAYRYNPDAKQMLGEEKYQFIKEVVFLGLEFSKDSLCAESNSYLAKLRPAGDDLVNNEVILKDDQLSECIKSLGQSLSDKSLASFDQCYLNESDRSYSMGKIGGLKLKYPELVNKRLSEVQLPPTQIGAKGLSQFKQRFQKTIAKSLVDLDRNPIRRLQRIKDGLVNKSAQEYCAAWSKDVGYDIFRELESEFKSVPNVKQLITSNKQFESVAQTACLNLRRAKVAFTEKNFDHTLSLVLNGK